MREPKSEREWGNVYRFRFFKYWIQSYLAGVRKVFVGMRDDDGVLRKVQHFATGSLHKIARDNLRSGRQGGRPVWEPFVILNFLDLVLRKLRRACVENVGCTISVRYEPQQRKVIVTLMKDSQFPLRMQEEVEMISK